MPTSAERPVERPAGRERRLFSVEDANRTLPLISRVVRDLVDVEARLELANAEGHAKAKDLSRASAVKKAESAMSAQESERSKRGGKKSGQSDKTSGATRKPDPANGEETQLLLAEKESLLRELALVGAELRDARRGTVDFPAERDGRPMLLSWTLGEERVENWREPDR